MDTERYMESLLEGVERSDSFQKTDEDRSKTSPRNVKKVQPDLSARVYTKKRCSRIWYQGTQDQVN